MSSSAPQVPTFKQLKIDLVDFNNLHPCVGAAIERIPGRNFRIDHVWIARGCGHPTPINCPSALCACCIIKNSLTSGHEARSRVTLEQFALKYCQDFFPELLNKPTRMVANVRQWQDCLNGYSDPLATRFVSVGGLHDTARERITACELTLRTLLVHTKKSAEECQNETKSPKQVSNV